MTEEEIIKAYAEHPDMEACMVKAKADGISNPAAHCKSKFDEEASSTLNDLAKSLELSEWDTEGLVAKIKTLQTAQTAGSQFEEQTKTEIAALKGKLLVSDYSEKVILLDLVPGTTKEKAEKLADLETSAGKDAANMVFTAWEGQQESAKKAQITETVLRPGDELPPSEFSEALAKVKEADSKLSDGDAIKKTMRDNPGLSASRNGVATEA